MFLLVRDEDVPTVAAAVTAFADEEGLEPVSAEDAPADPLAMLTALARPRATVYEAGDEIVVLGLETLDVGDAHDWGTALSQSCETEVVVVDVTDDGVKVLVFDGGELDEELDVPLDPSGKTRAPAVAELSDDDDGRERLTRGVEATSPEELAHAILEAFGVEAAGDDAQVLSFVDPLDAAPTFQVLPTSGDLVGRVGESLPTPAGSVFAVSVRGEVDATGVRLVIEGDALDLLRVEGVDVALRTAEVEQVTRSVDLDEGIGVPAGGALAIALEDAVVQGVDVDAALDVSDMFATMQRLMSAGETQQRNTILVGLRATATRAGQGALRLRAEAIDEEAGVRPSEASIAVHVR